MAQPEIDQIIARVRAIGGELTPLADGNILYRGAPLTDELRALLREHKAPLIEALARMEEVDEPSQPPSDAEPVACRGCAAVIPAGTTLCVECGSARSPLVRYAVQLVSEVEQRSLRGQTLVALDRKQYPLVRLSSGRSIGPGLLAWCPVLREMSSADLREVLRRCRAGS